MKTSQPELTDQEFFQDFKDSELLADKIIKMLAEESTYPSDGREIYKICSALMFSLVHVAFYSGIPEHPIHEMIKFRFEALNEKNLTVN